MIIEQLETSILKPYERNPRKHSDSQVEQIKRSIKEYGFNQPIVVDENYEIIVGHGRFEAARAAGLKTVPVVRLTTLTEEQKRSYRILDNQTHKTGDWDRGLLIEELKDLDLDLEFWALPLIEELPEIEDVEFDEVATATKIKIGDLIELGPHRVVCGGCEDYLAIAMQERRWDLLVTDPPYGVSYIGKTRKSLTIENDSLDPESLKIKVKDWFDITISYGAEGAVCYATIPSGPLGLIFLNDWNERGVLKQRLVWDKGTIVLGRSDYHYAHEPIMYGWLEGAAHYCTDDRTLSSIIEVRKPSANREHPTMKPVELWAQLIRNSSRKGDLVCDPFMGSGTTVLACEQLGRVAVGTEIDPLYCEVIIERYKKLVPEGAVKVNGTPR